MCFLSIAIDYLNLLIINIGDFQKGNDGYFYKFFDMEVNWENSKYQCEIQGGRLATNEGTDSQDFFIKNKGRTYWIGASFDNIQAEWVWVNKAKVLNPQWKNGMPIRTKQNGCVKVEKDMSWANVDCKLMLPFVCQVGNILNVLNNFFYDLDHCYY